MEVFVRFYQTLKQKFLLFCLSITFCKLISETLSMTIINKFFLFLLRFLLISCL